MFKCRLALISLVGIGSLFTSSAFAEPPSAPIITPPIINGDHFNGSTATEKAGSSSDSGMPSHGVGHG